MSVFPSGYLGLAKPRSVLTELEEKVFAPCYKILYELAIRLAIYELQLVVGYTIELALRLVFNFNGVVPLVSSSSTSMVKII
jgi:hypothetical protein